MSKYLIFGYFNKGMSAEAYMDTLTDYANENRPLNNLVVCLLFYPRLL